MRRDLALLSEDELEKAARHPRGREDARAIAEELASRRHLYSGAGTLPLFQEIPSSNSPATATLLLLSTLAFLLSTSGGWS